MITDVTQIQLPQSLWPGQNAITVLFRHQHGNEVGFMTRVTRTDGFCQFSMEIEEIRLCLYNIYVCIIQIHHYFLLYCSHERMDVVVEQWQNVDKHLCMSSA